MVATARKRKAPPLDVPAKDLDPAERKRVLNVLAQRRYRQRKKEHFQELEKRVEGIEDSINQTLSPESQSSGVDQQECIESQSVNITPTPISHDSIELPHDFSLEEFSPNPCLDTSFSGPWDPAPFFPTTQLPTPPSLSPMSSHELSPYNPSPSLVRTMSFSSLGADELNLPILPLTLMKAYFAIAGRLGIEEICFELNANSLFYNTPATRDWGHLPLCLRPTQEQIRTAHHPILDILPWPAVRDRLIATFASPEEERPPAARNPTALLDLTYDMEDMADGIRIWGEDPFEVDNWELGDKMFERWWWAMDSEVVRKSNKLRKERGAPLLTLGRPRVIEEVN